MKQFLIATLILLDVALGSASHAAPPESWFLRELRNAIGVDALREEFIFAKLPDEDLALDIYYPRTPAPAGGYPFIVWFHGGGWILGSKRQDVFVRNLAGMGYAVASVEYRLAGGTDFPAQVHDARLACWWLLKHAERLELNPDRMFLSGQSAGGHLALLVAYTEGRELPGWGPAVPRGAVKGVAAMYPPTDLLALVPPDARDLAIHPVALLLGDEVEDRTAMAKAASPISHVHPKAPPTLLLHGRNDNIVPVEQSVMLADRLAKNRVTHRITITPHGHAFTLHPDHTTDVIDFLNAIQGGKIVEPTDLSASEVSGG